MSDIVIVAIITGICSVIGQWLISASQNQKRKEEEVAREVRLEDRLKSVEKKLDEHNGYAKLFSTLTTDMAVIKNEIKHLREKGE